MIDRAVEELLARRREKGKKYPLNLLDYLNSASMEHLIVIECGSFFGVNQDRARIMLDASVALIRWTSRQGWLAGADAADYEKSMETLMKKIDG